MVIPAGAFGSAFPSASPTASPLVVPQAIPGQATPAQATATGGSGAAAGTGSTAGLAPLSPLGEGGLPGVETQLYQGGFDASWELDVFGGHRRDIEAADADTAAAIEDARDVLVSLEAEVARIYVELRSNQRQLQIATDNLHDQQETLELTRSRYHAGFVTQLDVARQAAQVASTAATLPVYEQFIQSDIHQLGILLGQDPDSLMDELSEPGAMPAAAPDVPVGVPAELLRRRPDIRRRSGSWRRRRRGLAWPRLICIRNSN